MKEYIERNELLEEVKELIGKGEIDGIIVAIINADAKKVVPINEFADFLDSSGMGTPPCDGSCLECGIDGSIAECWKYFMNKWRKQNDK